MVPGAEFQSGGGHKVIRFYRFLLVTVAQILLRGRNSAKLPVAQGVAENSLSAQDVIGILEEAIDCLLPVGRAVPPGYGS